MKRDTKSRIYKYPLTIADVQTVQMPAGADILYVAADLQGQLCIWAKIHLDSSPSFRRIYVVGTGHPIPVQAGDYLGSAVTGGFVWHVFEGEL